MLSDARKWLKSLAASGGACMTQTEARLFLVKVAVLEVFDVTRQPLPL